MGKYIPLYYCNSPSATAVDARAEKATDRGLPARLPLSAHRRLIFTHTRIIPTQR